MFPVTMTATKIAVDQVGRTAWQMTYFLSSRARWRARRCLWTPPGSFGPLAGFGMPPGLSKSISHWRCRVCACCPLPTEIHYNNALRPPVPRRPCFLPFGGQSCLQTTGKMVHYLVIIGFWMN